MRTPSALRLLVLLLPRLPFLLACLVSAAAGLPARPSPAEEGGSARLRLLLLLVVVIEVVGGLLGRDDKRAVSVMFDGDRMIRCGEACFFLY